MSQLSLWNKISNGDRSAFAKCFDQYWETLYHAAFWRVSDEELAKDLVQEIFITLWDRRADIVITDSLPGYLHRMLRNRIINHFKAEGIRQNHHQGSSYTSQADVPTPETETLWKESIQRYEAAVANLPEKMRKIFVLRHEEGATISDVAGRLGITVQTVKNQYTAAVKRIKRELLTPDGNQNNPPSSGLLAVTLFF